MIIIFKVHIIAGGIFHSESSFASLIVRALDRIGIFHDRLRFGASSEIMGVIANPFNMDSYWEARTSTVFIW